MHGVNQPARDDPAARKAAWSVFLILLAVFTATMAGLPDNTDSECEFQTTSALARTGWFALGGTPEGEAMAANPKLSPVRIGTDGEAYSWFGIGQAGAALPLYVAGRIAGGFLSEIEERHAATFHYGVPRSEYFAHLAVGWRNPILSALTAWMIVLVVIELGGSRRAGWLAGVSYGLASYAWPQARSTLSDVQAAFFLFGAFALLLVLRRRIDRGRAPGRIELLLFGFALGMAFLTRSLTAPALAVLVLALAACAGPALRRRGWKSVMTDATWAAAPALVCIAVYLVTNVMRFGDPFESGYGEPLSTGLFFNHPIELGFAGLTISPGRGLLWMAPLVLLAPWGAWRAWSDGRRLFVLVTLGVAVAVFAPVSKMSGWHGAWTYGPRYVLPALPFFWVATWLAYDRGGAALRFAFLALALFGLTTSLPGVLVDHETHQEIAIGAASIEAQVAVNAEELPTPGSEELFQRVQWDWQLAAPWAHWRILRHRISVKDDVFPVRRIFYVDSDAKLTVSHDRQRGWRHLWWVDLDERLGFAGWPALLGCALLVLTGLAIGQRALHEPA